MYSFVACDTKVGSITVEGPISKEKVTITSIGVWIKEEDAEILVETYFPTYCHALRKMVDKKVVYYATPTANQII